MFAYFLLTECELLFIICCRWWINSTWHRLRVRKQTWDTKIISSKAKSHSAGVAPSLSHLVTVMLPVAQLPWCHSVEGWTLRSTLHETPDVQFMWESLAPPERSHKDFKEVDLEEQRMRNNLFWWLYFLFVKYKQAQLMTLEPRSLLFILTSCLGSSRRQLSCHYQSHYRGLGGRVTSAHVPEVMTGHSYLWRRNQKWKQIVLKLASTLNTRRRKPNLLFLWNSQLRDYWGKICSFSEKKPKTPTTQNMPVQRSGRSGE